MTTNRSRQPAGVSTGGQYATEAKSESTVELTSPAPAASETASTAAVLGGFASKEFTGAVSEFRQAQDLKEYVDAVRDAYPGVAAINPEFGEDSCNVEYELADGTKDWVALDEDYQGEGDYPEFYPDDNNLVHRLAADHRTSKGNNRIPVEAIDATYTEAEQHYTQALTAALMPAWAPRTVQRVPELPEEVPAGHRIETDLDGDGDGRAILAGADGEPIAVVVDDPSVDYPIRAVDEGAPAWAYDHREAIADELQVAAANYRNLTDLLAQHIGDIPAVRDRLQALATGAQD